VKAREVRAHARFGGFEGAARAAGGAGRCRIDYFRHGSGHFILGA